MMMSYNQDVRGGITNPNPILRLQNNISFLRHRDFLGAAYFVVYDQLLTFTLLTLAPSLTLLVLNILIYKHLKAFR